MELVSDFWRGLTIAVSRLGVFVLAIVVGLGVPIAWVWIGSQAQDSTAPSWTALAVVHAGIIGSLLVIAGVFSWFVARSRDRERSRSDWMRGQSEERRTPTMSDTHPLEMIIFFAVFVDIIVFMVWFFFFADPGNPVGQG